MILIVDHYDSFTYNLVQLIEGLGRATDVVKSDEASAAELVAREPDAVVLSPGPGHPKDAGSFPELLRLLPKDTPVLGVCLGHQALGIASGGTVDRTASPTRSRRGDTTPSSCSATIFPPSWR
jgi:anthranilate synthase component 2